jgi:hypothetical protein
VSAFGKSLTRERIATKVTTKQDERARIKKEFTDARTQYLLATQAVVQQHSAKAEAVVLIQHDKDNMKGFEAGWKADGSVIGKNADEREACMAILRAESPDYQACLSRVAIAERDLRMKIEPAILQAEIDIRDTRYRMEFAITEGRMIAGEDDERHGR